MDKTFYVKNETNNFLMKVKGSGYYLLFPVLTIKPVLNCNVKVVIEDFVIEFEINQPTTIKLVPASEYPYTLIRVDTEDVYKHHCAIDFTVIVNGEAKCEESSYSVIDH